MLGPGKKGHAPTRLSRGASTLGPQQCRPNVVDQQVCATKGNLPVNASSTAGPSSEREAQALSLQSKLKLASQVGASKTCVGSGSSLGRKRSIQMRLFTETEEPNSSTDGATTRADGDGRISPMTVEVQANVNPTSQHEGSDPYISCGSNSNEGIEAIQNENSDSVKLLKRGRGPTRNIALAKKKNIGEKVKVHVSKTSGRLIGDGAQEFISEASCVLWHFGKWQAPKWAKLPQSDREALLKMVNNSFLHEEGDHIEPALLKQLNVQYRNRRHNFHKLFKSFKTKEEALSNCPPQMEKDDWVYLCNYFCSEEFQAISRRNAINRSKLKSAHTGETKSFLRHKTEREAKEGRKVGPIELYDMTHFSRKKNAMVDELSASNSIKLKERLTESQENDTSRTEEDICMEVIGHIPGHVRGRGVSRTAMMVEQLAEIESLKTRAEQPEKKATDLEAQVQAQQKVMDRLETQQRHTNSVLDALTAKFGLQLPSNENASSSCGINAS